jgi:N-acyl-D-amino-acid deacylase
MFLEIGGSACVGFGLTGTFLRAAPSFELVIRGGTVVDGLGKAPFAADLGLVGDRIEAIGSIAAEQGKRVLDVTGLHVCPGFIDIHSHSDRTITSYPSADSRVRQGITTELTGNCGSSAAPVGAPATQDAAREENAVPPWSDVRFYLDALDRRGLAINQALLLGQGTLRANAIGLADRRLTEAELAAVLKAVEEGLDQGAFGLSTGLEYTPGRYTPPDEILAMARLVARYGGLYATHLRSEESALLEALNEALDVGRRGGVRLQVSHLKAAGRPNWGKQRAALNRLESARRSGVAVLADAYPYTAYSTSLTILLSPHALEGGIEAVQQRLRDTTWRARIRREVEAQMALELGDYALIVIASVRTPANQSVVGKNLVEIAKKWGTEPVDAALRLIEEEHGAVSFIGHGMTPENVEMVLRHPLVMIGSDGQAMAPVGAMADSRPHPRSYGAFARVLSYYVRERRLFDLPDAIRKMTSQPADQIGLKHRGRIARGAKADLVAFDPGTVRDQATFESPHQYPTGIPHVIVNGTVVVQNGRLTEARPGKALRRG